MANETLTNIFSDIADAVRAKGVAGQMTPLQMPTKIADIPSGGGSKYGVTVDSFLGDVDANGALQVPSPSSFVFSSSDIVSIGDNVLKEKFKNNTGITQVNLPNLTTIGAAGLKSAFEGCTSLTYVNMPSITDATAGGYDNTSFSSTFNGCSNLTRVIINKNWNTGWTKGYLFASTFMSCSSLSYVEMPQISGTVNVSAFQNTFRDCSSLTEADFFSGVTKIYGSAFWATFYNCTSLTKVDFSNLTTFNGYNCADGICQGCTSLKEAYFTKLNNTGLSAWSNAFNGCTSLELVDFHLATAVPSISSDLFSNTNNTFQIVVPDELYNTWIAATNWSTYASQIVKYSEYTPAS